MPDDSATDLCTSCQPEGAGSDASCETRPESSSVFCDRFIKTRKQSFLLGVYWHTASTQTRLKSAWQGPCERFYSIHLGVKRLIGGLFHANSTTYHWRRPGAYP